MTEQHSPARRLRTGVWPVLDPASEQSRRERIANSVVALTRQLQAERQRRRRWIVGVALAAQLSAAGVAAVLWPTREGTEQVGLPGTPTLEVSLLAGQASLQVGSEWVPLSGSMQLGPDAALITPASANAELRLESSTLVSVAPGSQVNLSRRRPSPAVSEERLNLRTGAVALAVPKLGTTGKVSVETRDALVEVHGTRFTVRVVEDVTPEPFTEVQVREGRVLVRSAGLSRMLGPGDTFSSRAEWVEAAPKVAPPTTPTRAARKKSRRHETAPPAPSELAEQNRLLEAAELAQRGGMPRLALRQLEQLILRYPSSELAHNARVERFRLLERSGEHGAAVAAARSYLEDYPAGFARQEAEHVIGSEP